MLWGVGGTVSRIGSDVVVITLGIAVGPRLEDAVPQQSPQRSIHLKGPVNSSF